MALDGAVLAAVLFGALLHASWNALIKGGTDKSLDTALIHGLGIVIALPVVALVGLPARAAWPFLAASIVVHLGYYVALVGAYKHGDLGLTYPVMRGLAPLLVATSSAALIGEPLGGAAWAGVLAVSAGVIAIGLSIALVLWRRRTQLNDTLAHMRTRWPLALLGTAASFGSYAIALWAMTRAPVALVAALRETSVLFAALLGALWLKEGFGALRIAGTLAVVGGVMALRLA